MWGKRNCLSFETPVGGIEPTPDRRDHRLLVFLPKDTGKCGVNETVKGGIEKPSPRLTIRCSTARPLLPTDIIF